MSQEGAVSLLPTSAAFGASPAAVSPQPAAQKMNTAAVVEHDEPNEGSSDEEKGAKGCGKSRRELPAGAVATLKAWLLSPEHFTHPYPTPQDQIILMQKTGIDKKQLKNWFTNARRRIWKPMLKKQLEAGKLAATGTAGGGVVVPGVVPGLMVTQAPTMAPALPVVDLSNPAQFHGQIRADNMYANFQQAIQQPHQLSHPPQLHSIQQQQQQQTQQLQMIQQPQQMQQIQQTQQIQQPGYDFSNQVYQHQQPQPQQTFQVIGQQTGSNDGQATQAPHISVSNSIGSLPPMNLAGSSTSLSNQMIKTDSHAVLMELFARDQDLVRQAAGKGVVASAASNQSNNARSSAPNAVTSQTFSSPAAATQNSSGTLGQRQHSVTFDRVPTLSSWPHFSSVSSLNNLGGTLAGVKSITNLSAADLSSQGNLNKMGNLAQVKSVENMGRGDSYAFLEVFFDDKSGLSGGLNGSSGGNTGQRGTKRERDDDDAIGLSLDADEASPLAVGNKPCSDGAPHSSEPAAAAPPVEESKSDDTDGGKLKRAYDDALAARGLIAVRRSCEKLTDLALPAKMQRTLSQEYIRQHSQGQTMGGFFSSNSTVQNQNQTGTTLFRQQNSSSSSQQYPSQQPGPHTAFQCQVATSPVDSTPLADPSIASASVEVPSTTKCALCHTINVDTQLRPCGHMFHGRCLKPSLQNAVGPPKCPIDHTPMQSAVLAVPSASAEEKHGPVSL